MFVNKWGEEDPLGLGVKGRARESRLKASLQGLQPVGGPLVDPNWDAYFQAVNEAGGGKKMKFQYEDPPAADLSRDSEAVASQLEGMPFAETFNAASNQLGTPLERKPLGTTYSRASVKALRKGLGTR